MMRNAILTALDDESGFGLVEAMIAITILVIGLLAVSGLTLATAAQARIADLRNDQMIAGQSMIERMRTEDFDALGSRVDTVSANYQTYFVTSTVVDLSARAKQVTVDITPATTGLTARSIEAVLHKPRSVPAEP